MSPLARHRPQARRPMPLRRAELFWQCGRCFPHGSMTAASDSAAACVLGAGRSPPPPPSGHGLSPAPAWDTLPAGNARLQQMHARLETLAGAYRWHLQCLNRLGGDTAPFQARPAPPSARVRCRMAKALDLEQGKKRWLRTTTGRRKKRAESAKLNKRRESCALALPGDGVVEPAVCQFSGFVLNAGSFFALSRPSITAGSCGGDDWLAALDLLLKRLKRGNAV